MVVFQIFSVSSRSCHPVLCLVRMSSGVNLPPELVDNNSFRHSLEISDVI